MEGNVEAVDKDEKSVTINGVKYLLSDKLNVDWIKAGGCEYKTDQTGKIITYIKHVAEAETESSFAGAKVVQEHKRENEAFRTPQEIVREGCLNAAISICLANKSSDAEQIKSNIVIATAEELEAYVSG